MVQDPPTRTDYLKVLKVLLWGHKNISQTLKDIYQTIAIYKICNNFIFKTLLHLCRRITTTPRQPQYLFSNFHFSWGLGYLCSTTEFFFIGLNVLKMISN